MQTRMFLTSVSAIAISAGATEVAQAQDTGEAAGYSLSFQGTFGRLDNAPADKWGAGGGPFGDYQDKFGDPNTDMGYMGAISLERRASPERDIRLTFSVGGSLNNDRSFSSGFSGGIVNGTVTNELSFAAMDVEIGHHRAVGSNDLRLFAGLRGMTSSTSSDKVGSAVSGGGGLSVSEEVKLQSDFVGVGPRVGLGYSTKPAVGSFGFAGQIGAAALFGTRKDRGEFTISSSGGSSASSGFSESGSQTVFSLDAQIGINYYVSENSKISAGYAAQQLWNVDGFSDSDDIDVGPRLIDGVFLGFTTQF
ncbi:Major outer membrane precursor, Legionella pneumophila-type [Paracoccaceae bacterium]